MVARVKIKSDERANLTPIELVRDALGAELAVDANCAWPQRDLPVLALRCANLGVSFIEQPFPPIQDRELLRGSLPLPV